MRVLIAEDDKFFQKLLEQILAEHELAITHDGNEAWTALQNPDPPRLAILDWMMPGLSGPEICRKVRGCSSLVSTYLILLSAKNNEADIVSGLQAGADDYITKPPLAAELQARVKVGERILALQDTLAVQTALADQAFRRETHLAEPQADRRSREATPSQNNLIRLENLHLDSPSSRRRSHTETISLACRLTQQCRRRTIRSVEEYGLFKPPANLWDQTKALKKVDGDERLLRELVEIFLEESPKQLLGIENAIETSDPGRLERTAHNLLGELGYLGFSEAARKARDLERMGRERSLQSAAELFPAFQAEVFAVAATMRDLLKGNA